MNEKEFIQNWIVTIQSELKNFPDDFLENVETYFFSMPNKVLILGNQIFDNFEILTVNKDVFFQTDDFYSAKYILYANRKLPHEIKIPKNKIDLIQAVENYEKHLDSLFKRIRDDFIVSFPESQKLQLAFTEIINKLSLHRYRKEN
ncbi:MAG: hypothetical protein JXA68_04515 [Ignavibacteriales bacterium]|nr:hypothetical protein [Ignavibacteriales bacterium]